MTTSFIERLLPDFYRCAEQPGNWQLVLDQVRDELQVGSVVVQKFRVDGNRLQQQWVLRDSHSMEHAESHDCLVNNEENPRLQLDESRLPLQDVAVIQGDQGFGRMRQAEFRALDERLALLGLARPIILGIRYSNDSSLSMLLHPRCDGSQTVDNRHGQFLQQLAPHLKQSVSLYEKLSQLQQTNDTLSQCLDRCNAGVAVLGASGEVRWLNGSAREVLQRSRHLSLANGRLRCADPDDANRLAELVAAAASGESAGERFVGAVGPGWDRPVQLLAVPVLAASGPCVALYLSDDALRSELSPEEVVQLYGLTPAEARLAIALCEGATVNEYAEGRGVAVGTVRIQLKSIFSKLGLNRQPELVRLIGSSITTRTRSFSS
ncbi:PAS domain-containing protein [Parahaliea maris]|uniref:PAS domain-containing protein n=1 Tax=Parahaliea maris TaxID=2716870 RepID=A0A5C8ZWP7_9GAMM|nr:PAS domain-containing protein [Parahaliea maris]TXS91897.1 PAS domain-containing protein [Parahaliea maris]